MTKANYLNNPFESLIGTNNLSIPSKTILLEEGKIADRLYLIHKGYVFFSIMKAKTLLSNSSLREILLHHSIVYIDVNRVFFHWKVLSPRKYQR